MAWPIVKVTSGGIAVTEATNGFGTPVEVAANGYGTPVTYVAAGGIPVGTGGGSTLPTPTSLVFDGDSITEGYGDGIVPYPAQFEATTGKPVENRGHSGYTLAQMVTGFGSNVTPYLGAGAALVLEGGINDLLTGATGANLIASAQAYSAAARGAGQTVVNGRPFLMRVPTPTTVSEWNGTKQGHYDTYAAWLRANWATICDRLIDDAANPKLNNPDNQYYFSDKLHPTSQGYRQLSEAARKALNLPTTGDAAPSAFNFTDVSGAGKNTVYTTGDLRISGFTQAAPITVTGGTYSINGAAFTAGAGYVEPYDQVRLRRTSSTDPETAVSVEASIGGVTDIWSITTQADAPPNVINVTVADTTARAGNSGVGSYGTGAQFGAPAPDRWLCLAVKAANGTGKMTDEVYAAGAKAAFVIGTGSAAWPQLAFFFLPTGTSGDYYAEFDVADQLVITGILNITGLGAAVPAIVDSKTLVGPNGTINVELGSVLIAEAVAWQLKAGVWSGATEAKAFEGVSNATLAYLVPTATEANRAVAYSTAINGLTMACVRPGA